MDKSHLLFIIKIWLQILALIMSERSSYWQSYMGHLDEIQTDLTPLRIRPTVTLFDRLFLRKYKR